MSAERRGGRRPPNGVPSPTTVATDQWWKSPSTSPANGKLRSGGDQRRRRRRRPRCGEGRGGGGEGGKQVDKYFSNGCSLVCNSSCRGRRSAGAVSAADADGTRDRYAGAAPPECHRGQPGTVNASDCERSSGDQDVSRLAVPLARPISYSLNSSSLH